jgi:membrane-associated protein
MHIDLQSIIKEAGYVGVWAVIFAESGLLIGFFLPGDSLIFTAGFLASQGFFNIILLLVGSFAAAVIGDNIGYEFGKRVGKKLFEKEESFLFKKKHLKKAHEFYEKHGGKAIILARFMPVVRTFAPIVAGIAEMGHKKFTFFNLIGGGIWVFGLGLAGFFLGKVIPDVDKYLLPIIFFIVAFSVIPPLTHFWQENKEDIKAKVKHVFRKKIS